MDTPSGNDLSWLLYYLARPHIQVTNESIADKLESLKSIVDNSDEPGDPADALYRLFPLEITSNRYGNLHR